VRVENPSNDIHTSIGDDLNQRVKFSHPRYLQELQEYPKFIQAVKEALKELLQGNITVRTQETDVSIASSPHNNDKRTLQYQKPLSTKPPTSRVLSNASTTYSRYFNSEIDSEVFRLVERAAADFHGVGQKREPSQKSPPSSSVMTDHNLSSQHTTPALTELESLRVAYDLASDQYRDAVQYADAYRTIHRSALPPGQSIDNEVAAMVEQLEIRASNALSRLTILEQEIQKQDLAGQKVVSQVEYLFPSPVGNAGLAQSSRFVTVLVDFCFSQLISLLGGAQLCFHLPTF
jgi:hypothetical protein